MRARCAADTPPDARRPGVQPRLDCRGMRPCERGDRCPDLTSSEVPRIPRRRAQACGGSVWHGGVRPLEPSVPASIDRPWLAQYAPAVPEEIDVPADTLCDLLDDAVSRFADHEALDFFGATTTYAELGASVASAAEVLRRRGVVAGDRVALVLPNCPQHVVAFYAVLRLGAIVVEHNPLYTADELATQFADHGARVAIAWDKVVPTLQGLDAAHRSVGRPRRRPDPRAAHRQAGGPAPPDRPRPRPARRDDVTRARRPLVGHPRPPLLAHRRRSPPTDGGRRRRAAVHRRHHRRPQGRHAHAPKPAGECRPGPSLGARTARRTRGHLRPPPAVPRVRAHPVPDLRDQHRRHARAVPALRRGAGPRRLRASTRDLPARRAADVRGAGHRRRGPRYRPALGALRDLRRHGAPHARRRPLGGRHRRACSWRATA